MLKAYANSPEMQKAYLEGNAIKKAFIYNCQQQFSLFLTGEDESIGFFEFTAPRKRDVLKYWEECKVQGITLDTVTRR
jgi:hypothetical protein